MKFAFNASAFPDWDWNTIAYHAKELGYDGVELAGAFEHSESLLNNVLLSDPSKVKQIFAEQNIEIACLSSSIAMTGKRQDDQKLADHCKRLIQAANALGCAMVKVLDTQVSWGHSKERAAVALANWLNPLADFAADHHVCLLVENALSFRSARDMWVLLEQLDHPSIGCCWDILNPALIGEFPAVSVPMLNSRISYLQVKDAKLNVDQLTFCELGDGDLHVKEYILRLRGTGYSGCICVENDRAIDSANALASLRHSIAMLHLWAKPPEAKKLNKPIAHRSVAATVGR